MSGETVSGLAPGQHVVTFKDIPVQNGSGCNAAVNWITPESQTISISNGQTAQAVGTYIKGTKSLKAEVTGGLGDSLLMLLMASGCCRRKALSVLLSAASRV